MPVTISDLQLLDDFESFLTQKLIEARVDTLVMEQLRNRLLALQIAYTRLITDDTPNEPRNIVINNFISENARHAK